MMIYLRVVGDFVIQYPKDSPNLDLLQKRRHRNLKRVYMVSVERWHCTTTRKVTQVKGFEQIIGVHRVSFLKLLDVERGVV